LVCLLRFPAAFAVWFPGTEGGLWNPVRRTFGYIVFVVGVVLIVLAPLLRWYSFPRVAKAPTDVYNVSTSNGTGDYFSSATLSLVRGANLQNINVAKGDPDRSTHEVAVISMFQRTYNRDNGGDVDISQDVYAFDRVTGYAVHCCEETPRHEGLTLKFPFFTHRRSYLFYDSTAHKAFPAVYVRDQKVHGLNTFMFVSRVPRTFIKTMAFPGFLMGQPDVGNLTTLRYYEATTFLWVEPFTGAIIRGVQRSHQWLTDLSGGHEFTLARTHFSNTSGSIENTAIQIRTKYSQLKMVYFYLPIGGPIIGLILVLVGLMLLLRPPRERVVTAARPAAQASV
jgi:hypothetical protein